jgi:hypothetical protein
VYMIFVAEDWRYVTKTGGMFSDDEYHEPSLAELRNNLITQCNEWMATQPAEPARSYSVAFVPSVSICAIANANGSDVFHVRMAASLTVNW